jgi:peroxiredoxin
MLKQFTQSILLFLSCASTSIALHAIPSDPREVNPIEVGSTVPKATLADIKGNAVSLDDLLGSKKSILIFYRGSWCPYCTKHLAAIGQYEQTIMEKGYQIIAISPDLPETAQDHTDENEFNYSIYSDPDLSTIKAFGIAFEAESKRTDSKRILPVPALFIIDTEGRITFRHFDANYRERLSPEALINALD